MQHDNNNNAPSDFPPRVKLGGLWQNTTKTGKTYMSGDFGSYGQIQVWPNQKREGKNDPDFTVYIAEKKKKEAIPAGYPMQYNNSASFPTYGSSFPENPPNRSISGGDEGSTNNLPF